jgi:hypothetical protein
MHWFRKARYAIALVVMPLAGLSFATQMDEYSTLSVATIYLLLAGMFVLTVGLAYADRSLTE